MNSGRGSAKEMLGPAVSSVNVVLSSLNVSSEVPEKEGECFIPIRGVAECVGIGL